MPYSPSVRYGVWLAAMASTAIAAPKQPPAPAVFDDPCVDDACKHHALDAFRAALAAQHDGKADHPLRISYFGDSTTVPADHLLGLGGSAEGDGVIRFIPNAKDVHSVDVHYLAQPHGGAFEIVADG